MCAAGGGTGIRDGPAAEGEGASGSAEGEEKPQREFSGGQNVQLSVCPAVRGVDGD